MDDKKKKDISDLSAEDCLRLAAEKLGIEGDSLSSLELGFEGAAREMARLELCRRLNEVETSGPKKCPRCGRRCRIRVRAKERTIRTLSGSVSYRRNYHYYDSRGRLRFVYITGGAVNGSELRHRIFFSTPLAAASGRPIAT